MHVVVMRRVESARDGHVVEASALGGHRSINGAEVVAANEIEALRALADKIEESEERWASIPD